MNHQNHHRTRTLAACLALVLALSLAACGKTSSNGSSQQGSIKAGPGVQPKQITLGVLTDLSGTFAVLGQALTQGQQAYWKEQNAKGGVCGRQVKLIVKDHGYDPQRAVTLYRDLAPNVLALEQLLGSPVTAALLPQLERDSMYSALSAWPPSLLGSKVIEITGTTYDLEAINGIDWMMKHKGLKAGDSIGILYFEGDYGAGGLKGVQYAAQKHGLKVVQQKIKPTDLDMTGQVSAFKRAGVKALWVTTGPKQLASLVGVAASVGLNVPVGTNNPAFSPLLLQTPVAKALEANVTSFGSTAPISLDKPAVKTTAAAYRKYYPAGTPQAAVVAGWAESEVMNQVLQKACTNKDLHPSGRRHRAALAELRRHRRSDRGTAGLHEGRPGLDEGGLRRRRRPHRARRPEGAQRPVRVAHGAGLSAVGTGDPPPAPAGGRAGRRAPPRATGQLMGIE